MENNSFFEEKSSIPSVFLGIIIFTTWLPLSVVLFDKNANILPLLSIITITNIFLYWLLTAKLKVRIDKEGITYSYLPFTQGKKFLHKNITHIEIVEYDPLFDCGGWGIKSSQKYGKVRNTQGNLGLFITTNQNEKYLFTILDKSTWEKYLCEYKK